MQPYQLKNFWQELLVKSRDYLSEIACEKWIAPLKPISLEKNVLTLSTKDALHRQWVEERYLSRMEEAAFELSGEHLSIILKIAGKKVKVKPDDGIQTTLSTANKIFRSKKNPTKKLNRSSNKLSRPIRNILSTLSLSASLTNLHTPPPSPSATRREKLTIPFSFTAVSVWAKLISCRR